MIDFKAMPEPPERQLKKLPRWALEWIATLKQRLLYWDARGRGIEFKVRVWSQTPTPEAVFGLPGWAQDWIDLLVAEVKDKRDQVRSKAHRTGDDW